MIGAFHRKHFGVGDLQAFGEDVVDPNQPGFPAGGRPGPPGPTTLLSGMGQGRILENLVEPTVERPKRRGVEVSGYHPVRGGGGLQVRQDGFALDPPDWEGAPRRTLGVGSLEVNSDHLDRGLELGPILGPESNDVGRSVGQGEGLDLTWVSQGDALPIVIVAGRQFAMGKDPTNGVGLGRAQLLETSHVDLVLFQEFYDRFGLGVAVKQIRRHDTQLRTQT